jgi:hypothetical protein
MYIYKFLYIGSVNHESLLQFFTFAMKNLHKVSMLESDILVGERNSDKTSGRLSNIDLQNVIAAGIHRFFMYVCMCVYIYVCIKIHMEEDLLVLIHKM